MKPSKIQKFSQPPAEQQQAIPTTMSNYQLMQQSKSNLNNDHSRGVSFQTEAPNAVPQNDDDTWLNLPQTDSSIPNGPIEKIPYVETKAVQNSGGFDIIQASRRQSKGLDRDLDFNTYSMGQRASNPEQQSYPLKGCVFAPTSLDEKLMEYARIKQKESTKKEKPYKGIKGLTLEKSPSKQSKVWAPNPGSPEGKKTEQNTSLYTKDNEEGKQTMIQNLKKLGSSPSPTKREKSPSRLDNSPNASPEKPFCPFEYSIMPGFNSDRVMSDHQIDELTEEVYEPLVKMQVNDCWISREQDLMVIVNWVESKLQLVHIKHNGIRLTVKERAIDKRHWERLGFQGDKPGFNFRISKHYDYLFIRYKNVIATAHIVSLDDLFDNKQLKLEEQFNKTMCIMAYDPEKDNSRKIVYMGDGWGKDVNLNFKGSLDDEEEEQEQTLFFDVCQSYIDYKDHVVFGIRSNLYEGRKIWIIRTIKPVSQLHRVLMELSEKRKRAQDTANLNPNGPQGVSREIDIINDRDFAMIDGERLYVQPYHPGCDITEINCFHPRGSSNMFMVEQNRLTKVFRLENGDQNYKLATVAHDLETEIVDSYQFFYVTKQDEIYIKSEQMIMVYEYRLDRHEYRENKSRRVKKEKKDLPDNSLLLKVYQNRYVYIMKETDVSILDLHTERFIAHIKIIDLLCQPMYQMQNSPTIVDKSGFYNVFYPEALLSHHLGDQTKKRMNEFSEGYMINKRYIRKQLKNVIGLSSMMDDLTKTRLPNQNDFSSANKNQTNSSAPQKVSNNQKEKDESMQNFDRSAMAKNAKTLQLVDYVPQMDNLMVFGFESYHPPPADLLYFEKVNKIALVQVKKDRLIDPVFLDLKHFGKLIYRGFIKKTNITAAGFGMSSSSDIETLVYLTYTINSMKDGRFDHSFNVLHIPVDCPSQATQDHLFKITTLSSQGQLPIDCHFCWQKAEMLLWYQENSDQMLQSSIIELVKFGVSPQGKLIVTRSNRSRVLTSLSLLTSGSHQQAAYLVKPIFYANRLVYYHNKSTGALEVKRLFKIGKLSEEYLTANNLKGVDPATIVNFGDPNEGGALNISTLSRWKPKYEYVLSCKPLCSYQTIQSPQRIYRMNNIVLIQEYDLIYLTDVDGYTVKTCISGLFKGQTAQDRSLRDNIYIKNDTSNPNAIFQTVKQRVLLLNLFNFAPNSIPYQLLIRRNLFTNYDHQNRLLRYFRSIDLSSENDVVAVIKARTWSNPYMDLQRQQGKEKDFLLDIRDCIYPFPDIIKQMKLMNIYDLLSYNVINRKHFVYEGAMIDELMKKLFQIIDDLPDTERIPFIFPEVLNRDQLAYQALQQTARSGNPSQHDLFIEKTLKQEQIRKQKTWLRNTKSSATEKHLGLTRTTAVAFDFAIRLQVRTIIQNLLNLMIMCDPLGCLYQHFVAKNLDSFISFNLSLREYFVSSMPILTHEQFDYPQFHSCNATLYLPFNPTNSQETVTEIIQKSYYDRRIRPELDKIEKLQSRSFFDKYFNICRFCRERKQKTLQQEVIKKNQPKGYPFYQQSQDKSEVKTAKIATSQVMHLSSNLTMTKLINEEALHSESKAQEVDAQHSIQYQDIDKPSKLTEQQLEKESKDLQIMMIQELQLHLINKNGEKNAQETYEIEYSLVNMPKLIQGEKGPQRRRFMKLIQEEAEKDICILEIPVIQMVINFKWQAYSESFYIKQFCKTLFFMACFVIEIILTSQYGFVNDEEYYPLIAHIIIRSLCGLMIVDHLRYELRQLCTMGKTKIHYFTKDFWNVFDMLITLLYGSYIPISFIYDNDDYIMKIIQCSILLLFSIKFNFYLRIFDKFGFLVQMIVTVFLDLRFFLAYFLIIVSFFAIQVSIIMRDVEDHDGIGPFMFFVITLRTSLGDNDMDQQFSEYKILFWTIWFLIMVVGNIVLMNFIIAVVSQSYGQCMQRQVAQTYKTKVDMIVEREQMMSSVDMDDECFPKYILVRRPMDRDAIKAQEVVTRNAHQAREMEKMAQSIAEIKTEQVVKLNEDMREVRDQVKHLQVLIESIANHHIFKNNYKVGGGNLSEHYSLH